MRAKDGGGLVGVFLRSCKMRLVSAVRLSKSWTWALYGDGPGDARYKKALPDAIEDLLGVVWGVDHAPLEDDSTGGGGGGGGMARPEGD